MSRFRFAVAAAALLVLPALDLSPRLAAQGDDPTAELYKKVVDSAVFIVTPIKGGIGMGSGSLIDKTKRLVLTNYHVVGDADMVYVQFPVHQKDGSILTDKKKYFDRIPAGEAITGKVLYRDKTRDLALVQLDKVPPTAKQIKLAKKSPETGSSTWNIGSPGAVTGVFSMTGGTVRTVAVEDRKIGGDSEVLHIKCKMVTATNPANPGDSGGPLFNRKGEQVAVTESVQLGVQQVNRFVDVTEVRAFLEEKKLIIPDDDSPAVATKAPEVGPGSKKSQPKPFAPKDPPTGTNPGTAPEKKADPAVPTDPAAPSAADEQSAGQLLRRAKVFAEGDENRDYYKKKLNEVITKYPTTTAAKEAKKLLAALSR